MYETFEVTYRSGVKRVYTETAADIRSTASFLTPSFGPIVKVTAVKAPKAA